MKKTKIVSSNSLNEWSLDLQVSLKNGWYPIENTLKISTSCAYSSNSSRPIINNAFVVILEKDEENVTYPT